MFYFINHRIKTGIINKSVIKAVKSVTLIIKPTVTLGGLTENSIIKKPKNKNLVNLSHEVWPTLDWSGRLEVQKKHLQVIIDAFLKPGNKNDTTLFKR